MTCEQQTKIINWICLIFQPHIVPYSCSSSSCYVSPYLNGNVLKCTSHGAKADLFSQELQICFTWNILYFEHNPLNTLSTFCMFIYFPFSQVSPLPRSELLMHFDKLNSSRVQPIQTYRYDGVIFSNDQARIANFMFHDI